MCVFRIFQLTPASQRAKRRCYSPSALVRAYQAVKEYGVPVYRAAREHAVPLTTLRDRVDNRVNVDCVKNGPEPVLSEIEEAKLVAHIKELAAVGYGYTRAEVCGMATDFAVTLGKRKKEDQQFSMQWFYSFLKRWPELHVVKPSSLSEQRARCASEVSITNYFMELEHILTKYNLQEKPQSIYNIDEKGINTETRPPYVVAGKHYQPQMVMAERSKLVTVIGAGNALGSSIPPFFVFPGQRMLPDLMEGKTVGAEGTVTKSGWSNSDVFRTYMKEHFLKFVQGRNGEPILVLYDGHRSHIGIDLIEWARENNIILFVLPPHCSHILQPMDIGCFGPLQVVYSQECLKFSRLNHRTVTRYDVCGLACKAYSAALSPSNLQASFSKAGIYPLRSTGDVISDLGEKITPSKLYVQNDQPIINAENLASSGDQRQKENQTSSHENLCDTFFLNAGGKVGEKVENTRKIRRNISNVIGGKAVTEDQTMGNIKKYLQESKSSKQSVQNIKKKTPKKALENAPNSAVKTLKKTPKSTTKSPNKPPKSAEKSVKPKKSSGKLHQSVSGCHSKSPQPGPSHINLIPSDDSSTEERSESQMSDLEKCCVCKRFYVSRDRTDVDRIAITNWAECVLCKHWVHLSYCTPVRVVRRDTHFICPCCHSSQ